MRVGMYYNNSDVRVQELERPTVGDGEILIKVMASGVCGSDIMEWYRIKKAPIVLGHELTGEIVEAGSNVTRFKKGDRVFATHHVPCDECRVCLMGHPTACEMFQGKNNFDPGGFSEYLKVSGKSLETGVLKLPDEVSYAQGSFVEPLGTAVRGLRNADLKPGETLLVVGSGAIGLLIVKLAAALGAGRIIATDLHPSRLEAAKKFGAENTVLATEDVPAIVEKVNGRMADKVILCAGAVPAANQALQSVGKGGTVVFFAVPKPGQTLDIDFNPFWRNDVTLKTCYGAAPLDNVQALELIRSGRVNVDDMITHRLPLTEIKTAFQVAVEGSGLKVIVEPHDS